MSKVMELEHYPYGVYDMIYSDYLEEWIPSGFVRKYSYSDYVIIGHEHFSWNEEDLCYYSDDIDDGFAYWVDDILKPYMKYSTGARVDFILDPFIPDNNIFYDYIMDRFTKTN